MPNFDNRTPYGTQALTELAADPDSTLVAVDFDGTLSPIVDDPASAYVDPAAVAALGRVGALIGQVAIITGRPAETCVRLGGFGSVPGLERLIVLGQYGVERWDATAGAFRIPPAPVAIREVAAELPTLLAEVGHPDAFVEDKGRALGVHTRQLPDPLGAFADLLGPVEALASRHGLQLEPGRLVLEIRAAASDKGQALRELVAEVGARQLAFIGDDLGDLPAFEAVADLRASGLTGVRVCAASSEQPLLAENADVVVPATAGVATWLNALADQIEQGRQ